MLVPNEWPLDPGKNEKGLWQSITKNIKNIYLKFLTEFPAIL